MNVSPTTLAKGTWEPESGIVTMNRLKESLPSCCDMVPWKVGMLVDVDSRTWAGINKPGGHGKITHLYADCHGNVTQIDVKYIIGVGSDLRLDVCHAKPYQEPTSRAARSRRSVVSPETTVPAVAPIRKEGNNNNKENKTTKTRQSRQESVPQKKKTTTVQQPKRTLSLPTTTTTSILRPQKKKATLQHPPSQGRKRQSVDPTEASTSEEKDDTAPSLLPKGIPREIACEQGNTTFLSPLNDYSRLLSSSSHPRQQQHAPDVLHDSLSSFGCYDVDDDDDDMEDCMIPPPTQTNVVADKPTNNNHNKKSPISRTKPLLCGSLLLPKESKLERIQHAQLQVAKEFVQQVVQHTSMEQQPEEENNEREDAFCDALFHVLDRNDGLIPEHEMMDLVNEHSSREIHHHIPFRHEEVGAYVESFISKNRIMKSDGMIFWVG